MYFKAKNSYNKIKYKTCLPKSYIQKALRLAHTSAISGHAGISGTIERIKSFAYWPTMYKDAKEYVSGCRVCLQTKPHKAAKAPTLRNPEVQRPWDRLNMDLIGPLPLSMEGNKYILSIVDVLSRYGIATPLPDKSVATVTRAFISSVIGPYGPPRSIYSDQGKEFIGEIMKEVLKSMGVHQRHITVYRPQASGIVERFNGHLISILRSLVHEQPDSWDHSLPLATLAYNTSFHRNLRETPYYLFFLRDPYVQYDAILEKPSPWYNLDSMRQELMLRANITFNIARGFLEDAKDQQELYKNKNAKHRPINLGDRVYCKKMFNVEKLGSKYAGPMRVVKKLGVIYWLRDLATLKIYKVHVDRIKFEQALSKMEAPHVRDAYPNTKASSIESECERVSESELEREGLKMSGVKDILTDRVVNLDTNELSSTVDINNRVMSRVNDFTDSLLNDSNDNTEVRDNEQQQTGSSSNNNRYEVAEDIEMTYPLRNRGISVQGKDWIMSKPLEYKR